MSARDDVLTLIARLGEVSRPQLDSGEKRAADRLAAEGRLRVRWINEPPGSYGYYKQFYDPSWTPPEMTEITPLRLVK